MEGNGLYLAAGTILDERYEISEVLGAGGFGVTYKAYDKLNHLDCAIKEYLPRDVSVRENTLRVTPAANKWIEEFEHGRKRFIEEADTLRKLRSYRGIVHITDYFDENNTSYFVMEFIDGVNLNRLRKTLGGKIPYQTAREIILKVCESLDALHVREGIFHRDISPENIMIMANEDVKLIDFGNAKNISLQKGFSIVLKQGFAPLEQYSSSGKQGAYTDVYSLAATFYFILTGMMIPSAPERQTGANYTLLKDMQLGVPDSVSDAVDKALRLNYNDRMQSVGEFRQMLQEEAASIALVSTPSKTYTSRVIPYIEIKRGENAGTKHVMPANTQVTLGRSQKMVDISVGSDPKISRVHCKLFFDSTNSMFYLEDCSVNGTYVDKLAVDEKSVYPLEIGKRFVLGNHICEIEVGVSYE